MESIGQVVAQPQHGSARSRRGKFLLPKRSGDAYFCRRELEREWMEVAADLRETMERLRTVKLRWPLYLWGDVGRGKTYAALAFCDILEFARYWTVGNVMDQIIAHRPPWCPERWRWAGRSAGPNLVVLDELGLSQKDFEYDAVKRFCDWAENRPAIYISNHAPVSVPGQPGISDVYDKRICSRVTCGTVFELTGPDRRFE